MKFTSSSLSERHVIQSKQEIILAQHNLIIIHLILIFQVLTRIWNFYSTIYLDIGVDWSTTTHPPLLLLPFPLFLTKNKYHNCFLSTFPVFQVCRQCKQLWFSNNFKQFLFGGAENGWHNILPLHCCYEFYYWRRTIALHSINYRHASLQRLSPNSSESNNHCMTAWPHATRKSII